jgi:hypothetical protein
MDTAPLADPNATRGPRGQRAAASERSMRHSCGACGSVFTLHYTASVSATPIRARVPCMNDGCGAEIEVVLPSRGEALWTEEFS